MKKLIYKLYILIIPFGMMFSCNSEELLDQRNPNEISKATYWRNLSETQQGLNTVYQTLHKPGVINKISEILRSDLGYPGYGRPAPQNTEPFYLHTYNASTDEITSKWGSSYQGIFRANQVIEALNNLPGEDHEQTEWTSQMAQARFFRALYHYYLYTTFNDGRIIIRDFVPLTNEEFAQPLSPAEDVIAFIRQDLEYAYANLYKKGEYPDNDISKVTSGAAATILGTSYLQALEYTTAMRYFEDVINNHGYTIENDLSKMWTADGEFNSESIFEINFTNDNVRIDKSAFNGDSGTNWLNQQTSNTRGAVGPAWVTFAYKNEPMDPLDSRNYYNDSIKGVTLRNVPLRSSAMLAIVEDTQTPYYLLPSTSEYTRFHGKAWGFSWWKKYQNHDIVANENELPGGAVYSNKNVVLNRLSEVLLMQAECKIKTGDVDGAINLINKIRKRWGLVLLGTSGPLSGTYDDITYTQGTLMQHLMRVEKPLEMSIEGHAIRFLDFQRWKKSDNYGFKERLEELANDKYYGVNYTFINSNGQPQTRINFPSVVREQPNVNHIVIDYEYKVSALNYNEAIHGQYPIPFSEINSNPNIN
ncbi:RagB/SusD family nutrient uptake outer membrane protein [Gelidibacter salicanalis]|uniref:RagB/SusD family nutrient uptake outer membrane protein n=1 Tax=Gelidibacter salicanalis TaxID=291193 RepID=A0A934KYA6_9FLAO|nr:RagB/SusD family nutrient uptake outer membrane protein [Gelidibacter salicanalis]MBJ7881530.1 RagB/SusD family nutrient uptake outer membrane protein [Gelidibacter salicanalis]